MRRPADDRTIDVMDRALSRAAVDRSEKAAALEGLARFPASAADRTPA